ncbi:hypothetical protein Avbf_08664 [Armadillidium vulgare]|nr:hypothetical protein Avbf_08664 [Armadillidium vulgare]
MHSKRSISFYISKLVHVIFQTWVVWHVCIQHAPKKMTLLNVLNCTFTMFFPALSSTSLLISAICGPGIHFFVFYESAILVAMVIANTVIQMCRSKIILDQNNVKKLYELFFISESESEDSFLGPIMIIAPQVLFVIFCFCRKIYCPESRILKLIRKNDYSTLRTSEDLYVECDEKLEKDRIAKEFKVCEKIFNDDMISHHKNTEVNIYDQNAYDLKKNTFFDDENNPKDIEADENVGDVVGFKEKKKIKPPSLLFRVPSNSSNPSRELDSSYSEINSHNDTCLSTLDMEEDISLSTLRIDNSTSNRSVFSVTDSKQFVNELNIGSSSSPKSKTEENAKASYSNNLDMSVQFPMDITPKKSKSTTKGKELFDNGSSTIESDFPTIQHSSSAVFPKDLINLDCSISTKSNKCEKNKFKRMLKEFKLTGDTEFEKKFANAVIIFELVHNCNFLEWLFKNTKSPNHISKFIKYVDGKQNKEKIEKGLQEWIKVLVTSCKNINITTDPSRKFHREIQMAFMKYDYTYKKIRRDCKKVINYIEDLSGRDEVDEKKLTQCYTSLVLIDDDYATMCSENKEREENEKCYVKYLTLEDTSVSKIKPVNIYSGLEGDRKENGETILPEKDPNLDKLQDDKIPITRKNIYALHQLEINETPFSEKDDVFGEDCKGIRESIGTTDVSVNIIENVPLKESFMTSLEENIESNCEDQEKNTDVENNNNKNFVADSKGLKFKLINEAKHSSKTVSQGAKIAFNSERIGNPVNPNPSNPISIKLNNGVDFSSDSEDEYNDVIQFFDKIQKSIDDKKSLSAEEVFKKYGRTYYGGNSFLKAKKYIKEKHERNNKRRKAQEEEIYKIIEALYAKLNKINPQKNNFQKKLATARIEIDDMDPFSF